MFKSAWFPNFKNTLVLSVCLINNSYFNNIKIGGMMLISPAKPTGKALATKHYLGL